MTAKRLRCLGRAAILGGAGSCCGLMFAAPIYAADITVTTSADLGAGSLRQAIIDASAGDRILFAPTLTGGNTITLQSMLPLIDKSLTISGEANPDLVVDGNGAHRAFFVRSGTVTISSLAIENTVAQGGGGAAIAGNLTGVGGGGGGLGAGSAVFVDSSATVTLSSVAVQNSAALGGNGGQRASGVILGGGGGGGGLGGNGGHGGGGDTGAGSSVGGGGGGGGLGGSGGNSVGSGAGGGGGITGSGGSGVGGNGTGIASGGGGGSTPGAGGLGTDTAGNGGSGDGTALGAGGGGGGGGLGGQNGRHFSHGVLGGAGGNGGYGGGGGGAAEQADANPGTGGAFGGGGGEGQNGPGFGGAGGYGGGGGGAGGLDGTGGAGGFGGGGGAGGNFGGSGGAFGGAGGTLGGGGGGALGGAIFVRQGGNLILQNSSFIASSATAGSGAGNGGNGVAAGDAVFLHNVNLAIDVSANQSATLSDSIADHSGGGGTASSLTKTGLGELNLTGTNTYAGDTFINAGRLTLNGWIAGDAVVMLGAQLGGNGTVQGDVRNAGRLAPGNSIGTFNIAGDFDSLSGSSVEIEVEPGGTTPGVHHDQILITGQANLSGGTVAVVAAPGTYSFGAQYTFLIAGGGVNGTFDGIVDDFALFNAVLVYGANTVGFELSRDFGVTFAGFGQTYNQASVGAHLDEIAPYATGDLADVAEELSLISGLQVPSGLGQLGGQIYPTLAAAQLLHTSNVLAMQRNQLARSPACWNDQLSHGRVRGYGLGGETQSDSSGTHGMDFAVGGTEVSLQRCLGSGVSLGGFGDFAWAGVGLRGLDQRSRVDTYLFGMSAQHVGEQLYQLGILGGGFQSSKVTRAIDFTTPPRAASSAFSGSQGFVYMENGARLKVISVDIQPYLALQYVHLHQSSFTESGADSINLIGEAINADSLRSILGTSIGRAFKISSGVLTPQFRTAWMHELLDSHQELQASFSETTSGSGFVVRGVDLGRDWATAGVDLRFDLHNRLALFGGYENQFNRRQTFHTGSGGLELRW